MRVRQLGLQNLHPIRLLSKFVPVGVRGRNYMSACLDEFPPETTLNRLLEPELRRAITSNEGLDCSPEEDRGRLIQGRTDTLDRMMALDFLTLMCDDILVKVDRAAMLNSIEFRAPYLDQRVIEYVYGEVALDNKVRRSERKRLLRTLAARLLPPAFDMDRKQGFSIPISEWFCGEWNSLASLILEQESPLFDRKNLRKVLSGWNKNDRAANRMFQLAMLESWRRQYNVAL